MALVEIEGTTINTEHIYMVTNVTGEKKSVVSSFTFLIRFIQPNKLDFQTQAYSGESLYKEEVEEKDKDRYYSLPTDVKYDYTARAYEKVLERKNKLIKLWAAQREIHKI